MKSLLFGGAVVLAVAGVAAAHHTVYATALAAGVAAVEEGAEEKLLGPHDGALVPLGDGVAVLEFTFEPDSGMFHMYVWDATLENPVRLAQNMIFLKVPLENGKFGGVMLLPQEDAITGEQSGDSATFAGGLKTLKGRESFDVVLEGVVVDQRVYALATFPIPGGNGLGAGHPPREPEVTGAEPE